MNGLWCSGILFTTNGTHILKISTTDNSVSVFLHQVGLLILIYSNVTCGTGNLRLEAQVKSRSTCNIDIYRQNMYHQNKQHRQPGLYAGYNYCQSHMFWWMLTVKPVYKLLNVSDHLKWTTNTHVTVFTHFQGTTNNIYGFGRPFLRLHFFYPSTTRPPYLYPSIFVFTRPNDGWTGLYIKLCRRQRGRGQGAVPPSRKLGG